MALNANAIVTLAEAKLQLNITTSNTNEDTMLEAWINETSQEVEDYCQRKFVVQSVSSEYHNGDGSRFLYPKYFPVTQLSTETTPTSSDTLGALQYRDTPDSSWTNIETDTDHIFYGTDIPYIELYDTTFPSGRRNIKISYKAGYSTVPADVKKVVLEKIQIRWNTSGNGGNLLGYSNLNQSEPSGNISSTIISLEDKWNKILDRYRIYNMG